MKVKDLAPTVAQHNYLIRSHLSFGSLEARLFTILLANIRREDTEFNEFVIKVSDVVDYRPSAKTYALIKDAVEALHSKKLNLLDVEDDKRNYHSVNFFEEVQYTSGTGLIKITFGKKIMPYLLQLKDNFTLTEIERVLSLKSGYAHRMYWLLKSYEYKGEYRETVDELKRILTGSDNLYSRYFDFKKKVLTPAFDEVGQVIGVELEEEKVGRAVTHIRFTFKKGAVKNLPTKKPAQPDLFNQPLEVKPEQENAYKQMLKYGLDEPQIAKFLKHLTPEQITKTIHKEYLLKKDKVANPAAHIYEHLTKQLPFGVK